MSPRDARVIDTDPRRVATANGRRAHCQRMDVSRGWTTYHSQFQVGLFVGGSRPSPQRDDRSIAQWAGSEQTRVAAGAAAVVTSVGRRRGSKGCHGIGRCGNDVPEPADDRFEGSVCRRLDRHVLASAIARRDDSHSRSHTAAPRRSLRPGWPTCRPYRGLCAGIASVDFAGRLGVGPSPACG